MKSKIVSVLMTVVLGSLLLAGTASAADTNDVAWISLFNGKDLTGWKPVYDVSFDVKDGNLHLVKGMGWLRTEKEYGDFNLEFECRALVAKYDSGFFFRCALEGQPWPTNGFQLNLRYDQMASLVKGYRTLVPSETDPIPANKWMKIRVEAKGKKVVVFVDGEKAWEYNDLDRTRGYMGIQAEDKEFDFRNIRVQPLD